MVTNGWDIIGDVHGRLGALEALLRKLGYEERNGVFEHPSRRALFIGDMVDRGPQVGEVLRLVRAMVEAGAARAVLGNHEYNVLRRLHQKHRTGVLPEVGAQKERDMTPTLPVLEADPGLERWLLGLPLWLEIDGARFVHAYWGGREFGDLDGRQTLIEAGWTDEAMVEGALRHAIDRILKGPETGLPVAVTDKHGNARREGRIAWWKSPPSGATLNDLLITPSEALNGQPAARRILASFEVYAAAAPPVFIGHYGFLEPPGLLAPNVACVDFGTGGRNALAAYRWNGETALDGSRFEIAW